MHSPQLSPTRRSPRGANKASHSGAARKGRGAADALGRTACTSAQVSLLEELKLNEQIRCCAVGSSGTIWTGEKGGTVRIRNSWTGQELVVDQRRKGEAPSYVVFAKQGCLVNALVYVSAHEQVWAAFSDGSIRAFSEPGRSLVREMRQHSGSVTALASSGGYVFSGGQDWKLYRWDVATFKYTAMLTGHRNTVHSIETNLACGYVYSGAADGTIRMWHLGNGTNTSVKAHEGSVLCLRRIDDKLWSAGEDGTINVWKVGESLEFVTKLHGEQLHSAPITSLLHLDYGSMWSTDKRGVICVWDPDHYQVLHRIQPQGSSGSGWQRQTILASCVADRVVQWRVWACSGDGTTRIWGSPATSEDDEVHRLQREKDELQAHLASRKMAVEEMQQRMAVMAEDSAMRENETKILADDLKAGKAENTELRGQVDALMEDLERYGEKVHHLESLLRSRDGEHEEYKAGASQEMVRIQEECEAAHQQRLEQCKEIHLMQLEAALQKAEMEYESKFQIAIDFAFEVQQQRMVEALEESRKQHEAQTQEVLQAAREQSKAELQAALDAAQKESHANVKAVKGELSEALGEVAKLRADLAERDASILRLEGEVALAQKEVDEARLRAQIGIASVKEESSRDAALAESHKLFEIAQAKEGMRVQCEEANARVHAQLREQLEETQKAHLSELHRVKAEHQAELAEARRQHSEEVLRLRVEIERVGADAGSAARLTELQIAEARLMAEREAETAKKQAQLEVAEAKLAAEREIDNIRRLHEVDLAEAKLAAKREIENIKCKAEVEAAKAKLVAAEDADENNRHRVEELVREQGRLLEEVAEQQALVKALQAELDVERVEHKESLHTLEETLAALEEKKAIEVAPPVHISEAQGDSAAKAGELRALRDELDSERRLREATERRLADALNLNSTQQLSVSTTTPEVEGLRLAVQRLEDEVGREQKLRRIYEKIAEDYKNRPTMVIEAMGVESSRQAMSSSHSTVVQAVEQYRAEVARLKEAVSERALGRQRQAAAEEEERKQLAHSATLSELLEEREREIGHLRQHLDLNGRVLEDKEKEILALHDELARMRSSAVRSEVDSEQAMAALNSEVRVLQQQLTAAKEAEIRAKEEARMVVEELQATQDERNVLHRDAVLARELEVSLSEREHEITRLHGEVQSLRTLEHEVVLLREAAETDITKRLGLESDLQRLQSELEGRFRELREKEKELLRVRQASKKEIEDANQVAATLRITLDTKEADLARLQSEFEVSFKQKVILEQKVEGMAGCLESKRIEAEELRGQVQKLEDAVSQATGRTSVALAEVESLCSQLRMTSDENTNLHQQIRRLESALSEAREEEDSREGTVAALQEAVERHRSEVRQAKAALREATAAHDRAVTDLLSEVAAKREEAQTARENTSILEEKLAIITSMTTDLERERMALQETIKERDGEIAAKASALEKQRRAEAEEHQDMLLAKTIELEDLRSTIARLEGVLRAKDETLRALETAGEIAAADSSYDKEAIARLREEATRAAIRNEELSSQLDEAQSKVVSQQLALDQLQAAAVDRETIQETADRLQYQLVLQRDDVKRMQCDVEAKTLEVENLLGELTLRDAHIAALRGRIAALTDTCATLEKQQLPSPRHLGGEVAKAIGGSRWARGELRTLVKRLQHPNLTQEEVQALSSFLLDLVKVCVDTM